MIIRAAENLNISKLRNGGEVGVQGGPSHHQFPCSSGAQGVSEDSYGGKEALFRPRQLQSIYAPHSVAA